MVNLVAFLMYWRVVSVVKITSLDGGFRLIVIKSMLIKVKELQGIGLRHLPLMHETPVIATSFHGAKLVVAYRPSAGMASF
jgi:hypothetical protein